jgi:hypothetical protein
VGQTGWRSSLQNTIKHFSLPLPLPPSVSLLFSITGAITVLAQSCVLQICDSFWLFTFSVHCSASHSKYILKYFKNSSCLTTFTAQWLHLWLHHFVPRQICYYAVLPQYHFLYCYWSDLSKTLIITLLHVSVSVTSCCLSDEDTVTLRHSLAGSARWDRMHITCATAFACTF